MYAVTPDPYCYKGTDVLRNVLGIRDSAALSKFEAASTTQRSDEPLPSGRYSVTHYRAVHRHLFQDVYRWAGRFRTVRLNKAESHFCFPEHIEREMQRLFRGLSEKRAFRDMSKPEFVSTAAHFLAELNAIHPFREGNGRAQTSFLVLLAAQAAHPIDLHRMRPTKFLAAMIDSFAGNEEALKGELSLMIA